MPPEGDRCVDQMPYASSGASAPRHAGGGAARPLPFRQQPERGAKRLQGGTRRGNGRIAGAWGAPRPIGPRIQEECTTDTAPAAPGGGRGLFRPGTGQECRRGAANLVCVMSALTSRRGWRQAMHLPWDRLTGKRALGALALCGAFGLTWAAVRGAPAMLRRSAEP